MSRERGHIPASTFQVPHAKGGLSAALTHLCFFSITRTFFSALKKETNFGKKKKMKVLSP